MRKEYHFVMKLSIQSLLIRSYHGNKQIFIKTAREKLRKTALPIKFTNIYVYALTFFMGLLIIGDTKPKGVIL